MQKAGKKDKGRALQQLVMLHAVRRQLAACHMPCGGRGEALAEELEGALDLVFSILPLGVRW